MSSYLSLADASLDGKKVLLRAGFDVPIEDGKVTDESRIVAIVPTMKYIVDEGASLIIMAHQDRPKGKVVPEMSQKPLVEVLERLLGRNVLFAQSCTGDETKKMVDALAPGDIVLLENLRFDAREEKNDEGFAKELAELADIYVNDAFSNCHRAHASMVATAKLLPAYMGLQLEQEITYLEPIIEGPKRPLALIISGAKIETKLPVIERFLQKGDDIIVGGAIANTFAAAQGCSVGSSLYEPEFMDTARTLIESSAKKNHAKIHVLSDAVVAPSPNDADKAEEKALSDLSDNLAIFDIGPDSVRRYIDVLEKAETIVWNGPLGMYEEPRFAKASKEIAQALQAAHAKGKTVIIGGGDTVDFHIKNGLDLLNYTFVSTGGGAMLDFLAGDELPALAALKAH